MFLQVEAWKFHPLTEHAAGHAAAFMFPGKHLLVASHHPHYGAAEQISQSFNSKHN